MNQIPSKFKPIIKGVPRWFDDERVVTPGSTQMIKQEVVAAGKKIDLVSLKLDSTTYGVFRVIKRPSGGDVGGGDDALIGSGQTGPAANNIMFWGQARTLDEGDRYTINFDSFASSTTSNVRTHLLLSDR